MGRLGYQENMRILGFVLSAAALHVVVLALNPDNNNQKAEEFVVGVALVQRQKNPFMATGDNPSGGQDIKVADSKEQAPVEQKQSELPVKIQELPSQSIEQELPAEVHPRPLEPEKPIPDVAEEAPMQPAQGYQQSLPSPESVAVAAPDTSSALSVEQADPPAVDPHPAAETVPESRRYIMGQRALMPAKPQAVDGVENVRGSIEAQVMIPPSYLYNPDPAYPRMAKDRGWEGTVELMVRVLTSGKVGEVKLENSSGYRNLDDAARRAIKRWRFDPARRAGRVVESWVVVPVHFVLDAQIHSR